MKKKIQAKLKCVCGAEIEVCSDIPSFVVAGIKRFEKKHERCKKK
jgi:hypothetical protein